MATPREKQAKAIEFIQRAIERGFKHVVIAAPTGVGKSAIGASVCLWAASENAKTLQGEPGGYYLVTQKMLQDQLERDFVGNPQYGCVSIKSATAYECDDPKFKTCDLGRKKRCGCTRYVPLREQFQHSKIGVTNYAYFITERLNVGSLPDRRVMVLDECHNIERLLVRFFDITIGPEQLEDTEFLEPIPDFKSKDEFINWCNVKYRPRLEEKAVSIMALVEKEDKQEYLERANRLAMQLQKLTRAIDSMTKDPKGWIFWGQDSEKVKGDKQYIARPLFAHEFTKTLFEVSDVVVHMSAFPGEKHTYCTSLGLDPNEVAWATFTSTFPVENRPIRLIPVGSMSLRNITVTLPKMAATVEKVLNKFSGAKGLIHCNSYKVGQHLYDTLSTTAHRGRLIFPKNADEREAAFERHASSKEPTVIISPSMTEGFDFHGHLAEWQIIAKVPFPNLGDKHTTARKDVDDNWYKMETIKTIVQACGRIVRSETDKGTTYILDADMVRLVEEYPQFFPKWWMSALIMP